MSERRKSGGAAIVHSARDVQIVGSSLNVVGGDVHNHYYHRERQKDIWAILQSIPNFRSIYQDMLSKATPGTGVWLLKGDKFRLWLEPNGDIKIFWGSGIPGAGKTLLACIVIKHIEDLYKGLDVRICVCHVYFRYSERAEVTVRDILESLVKQTLERHPECHDVVDNTYAQHLREGTQPAEAQLLALLRQLNEGMTCIFYILDALDEAPTKIQLTVVKTLASLNVKLFITSRPLKTVEANFPQAYIFPIIAQDVDLDLHITKGIEESADLQHLLQQAGSSLREEIFSTVKQNCGGMFLHAALQLDALSECLNARDVRNTLKVFPTEIEGVYRQTWSRICNQGRRHASLAKTVLVWVLNASRSMTVEELARAVATSPETHKFEPNLVVPSATLMALCRGLVTVEDDSRLVRLVHYTAKNTLEELLHESFPHPHCFLAAVCMTHLIECGFQNTTIESEHEFRAALTKDPLLAYASEAWAFHARAGLDDEESKRRTEKFISESNAFPAFANPAGTSHFDILTPLHIVALYHLPQALFMDATLGNPNVTTKLHRRTPLIVASQSGHEEFVASLITLSDIEVNLADAGGYSALMHAAWYGREVAVKLLLAHPDVRVNLVDSDGQSALMLAAKRGCEGVVKLLLTYPEIQVNLVNSKGWSALMWAVHEGHEGIVKLLLASLNIQVNMVRDDGWSTLMWAAHRGHECIVKLLMACLSNRGNLAGNDGWSTLMWAVRVSREDIVKLLLGYPETPVNLVGRDGGSALTWAAYWGYEGVVKLLLMHPDIQLNLVTNSGLSALMLAASEGHEGIVKLLLAYPDTLTNLVDNVGWSALLLAASEGHEGVVRLLLAHPESQASLASYHGSTALLLAAEYGHAAVVELLLTTGAFDVNAFDNGGDTAIKMAAQRGHEFIVRLLLNIPNVDTKIRSTTDGHTAMSAARANGHDEIVELLQGFESLQAVVGSLLKINQLSVSNVPIEDGSDSDTSECWFDAEETLGEDVVAVSVT